MTLWIDGDSCHRKAMDIAFRSAARQSVEVVIIADREIPGAEEHGARVILLPHGSGEVDNHIAQAVSRGDIAITRDLALGVRLIDKGCSVMNDRGRVWTMRDLRSRMEEAELMRAMRAGGMVKKAMRSYEDSDARRFAAALEKTIARKA